MDRILVATSAAHLSAKLSRAPQVTGVLHWRYEDTGLYGIIVKTRVPFDNANGLTRPDVMLGTPEQSETLLRPIDFVPSKPWIDVALTGSFNLVSKRGEPIRATARLVLGEEETPISITSEVDGRIAISERSVRVIGGTKEHCGINESLNPAETEFDHPEGFPFELYSFSHPALARNLGTLTPGMEFFLQLDDQPEPYFKARIPERAPRVLVEAQDGDEKSRIQPLHLDTLIIDVEKCELELTWRGSWFRRDDPSEIDRVLIGWATEDEWEDGFAELYREMGHGHFEWAWSYEDAVAGIAPPELNEDELEDAMYSTLDCPFAPDPRITVEEFAKIQAELNEARQPRPDIFQKHDTSEFKFALESRAWTERMMEETLQNPIEAPLATRYAQAMARESQSFARPHEQERTLREFAELRHRMSIGDPSKALKQAKLSLGEWIRWERDTMTRLQADPRAAEELEHHLSELQRAAKSNQLAKAEAR